MVWDINLKKIVYSRFFWILLLNLVLISIPISGIILMRSRDYRSITMRRFATKNLGNSIKKSIHTNPNIKIIHFLPIVAPYQRIIIVETNSFTILDDTKWNTNYYIKNFKYESPINKLIQDIFGGYPEPTLENIELINRLKKYIKPKTTKLSIIDYRFFYYIDHITVDNNDYTFIILTDKSDILESSRVYKISLLLLTITTVLIAGLITLFYYRLIIKPLKDLTNNITQLEDGKVLSNMHLNRDDEIGTLSQAFYYKTTQLLEKNKSFEEFTSDILHEIKNPLTSIRNSIELLNSQNIDINNKDKLLQLVKNESGRIEKLLYDVQEYSRIDKYIKVNEKCNPSHVISKVLQLYSKFGIKSDINCNTNLSISEIQLVSVITNLLDNAISFSPVIGSVKINCNNRGFSITDMGPGIPDCDKDYVFNRFFSNRHHNDDLHSGLGLSIVKTILENNNHSINFISTEKGTTFNVLFNVIKL